MTFTTSLKEEISKIELSPIEARCELFSFIKFCGKLGNEIVITLENASVARKIYKDIKLVYNFSPVLTVRIQKRFRVKQIYIITIKENVKKIKEDILNSSIVLESDEEKIAYLQGAFLAIGNISNPQTSGYHLEFICKKESDAKQINSLLKDLEIIEL